MGWAKKSIQSLPAHRASAVRPLRYQGRASPPRSPRDRTARRHALPALATSPPSAQRRPAPLARKHSASR
eukprot:scaffold118750_cov32-Tisochrysis_lutea.AAC.4